MTVECDVLAKDIVVNDSAVLWVVSLVNAVRSQTHTLTPDGVTQMLLKRCVRASVRACVCVCEHVWGTDCMCAHNVEHCTLINIA